MSNARYSIDVVQEHGEPMLKESTNAAMSAPKEENARRRRASSRMLGVSTLWLSRDPRQSSMLHGQVCVFLSAGCRLRLCMF
jgi:hypothetical protein